MEHRHDNPVTSLEHAHVNQSIIYITTHERKAPINVLSRRKTTKTKQVEGFTYMYMRETSGFLVTTDRDGTFASTKTLLI